MLRFRLRLVVLVTLVSYLLASGHASLALCAIGAVHERPLSTSGLTVKQSEQTPDEEQKPAPCCKHCNAKKTTQQQETSENVQTTHEPVQEAPTPCQDSDDPRDESCPCCPKGPGGNPCHLPGGCAYCNVAKIPCVVEPSASLEGCVCLGEACCELPILYISPSGGSLIRPPKI